MKSVWICQRCRSLNSLSERRCQRCGARAPNALVQLGRRFLEDTLGSDYPLTKVFLGVCAGIYLFGLLESGWQSGRGLLGLGALRMSQVLRWGALGPSIESEPWRFFSAIFVHFSALHLLFNGFALVDFGRNQEPVLGSARFAVLFLISGVVGFLASDWYYGGNLTTAGASGALFGLVGCQIGQLFAARDPAWKQVALRALVYGVVFGLAFPVNNLAHAGGFVVGCVFGYGFHRERRKRAVSVGFQALATVLIAISISSLVLSHRSSLWKYVREMERQAS